MNIRPCYSALLRSVFHLNSVAIHTVRWLLFGCIACFSVTAFAIDDSERYVRVSKSFEFRPGGHETGFLVVRRISKTVAKFDLNVGWSPNGVDANIGVIEDGTILLRGNVGSYSLWPTDPYGPCELNFSFNGQTAKVKQPSHCALFGAHVNASGTYKRTKGKDEGLVK